MTPEKFIALWRDNPLSERAGAQGHFDDLCELLGVDKPRDLRAALKQPHRLRAGTGKSAAAGGQRPRDH